MAGLLSDFFKKYFTAAGTAQISMKNVTAQTKVFVKGNGNLYQKYTVAFVPAAVFPPAKPGKLISYYFQSRMA